VTAGLATIFALGGLKIYWNNLELDQKNLELDQTNTALKKVENLVSQMSASLQAAELRRPDGKENPHPPDTSSIVRIAQRASSVSLSGAKVLWVDDNPDNNRYEREALAQLGVQFVIARSTSEALQQLGSQAFNAVITDFARKDDPEGGYTLLAEVKKTSPTVPVIIYTGSFTAKQESEAKGRGAYGETNSPVALFELVIDAIKRR